VDGEFVDDRSVVLDGQTVTIANAITFRFTTRSRTDTESLPSGAEHGVSESVKPQEPVAAVPGREESQPAAEHPGSARPVFTLVRKDAGREYDIELSDGIHLVGRDDTNAIILQDPSVSRHHGVVVVKEGQVSVRDLDSKNHTFADGKKVDKERQLHPGSIVMFGLVAFELVASHRSSEE
jgi:hypothetical protein